MDSSAMATRRMHMFMTLAAGGAIMFMAGAGMVLIGEAMQIEKPAGWQELVTVGLVLAGCGLAGGVMFAVLAATALPARGQRAGRPRPASAAGASGAGPAAGGPAVTDPAEDWLSPLRGGGLRPVSSSARATAAARAAQAPAAGPGGWAKSAAGHPGGPSGAAQYSDQGWHLEGAELAQPGPVQHRRVRQAPPQPPHELAQPSQGIRPSMLPPTSPEPSRWPGSDAGQAAACAGQPAAAFDRGPEPAQYTGQFPAYDPGSQPTYGSGPESAYDPGPELAHDSGPRHQGYDPGRESARDPGHPPAYLPAPPADAGDLADQRQGQG